MAKYWKISLDGTIKACGSGDSITYDFPLNETSDNITYQVEMKAENGQIISYDYVIYPCQHPLEQWTLEFITNYRNPTVIIGKEDNLLTPAFIVKDSNGNYQRNLNINNFKFTSYNDKVEIDSLDTITLTGSPYQAYVAKVSVASDATVGGTAQFDIELNMSERISNTLSYNLNIGSDSEDVELIIVGDNRGTACPEDEINLSPFKVRNIKDGTYVILDESSFSLTYPFKYFSIIPSITQIGGNYYLVGTFRKILRDEEFRIKIEITDSYHTSLNYIEYVINTHSSCLQE